VETPIFMPRPQPPAARGRGGVGFEQFEMFRHDYLIIDSLSF
jgi:hypothetical protein